MPWFWVAGYLFAIALLFLGLSRQTRFKIASKQVFVGLGFFVLIAMTAILLDARYHWSQNIPEISLAVLGCFIILYRAVGIVRHRLRAGAMLVDLGRVPIGEFLIEIIVAGALAANAVIDGLRALKAPEWTLNDISFEVLELSVAFAVFVQGVMKRSVREHGIFHGTGLIPWARIDSYTWEGGRGGSQTLVLQKQSSIAMLRTLTLSVDADRVEAVEQLLQEHNVLPAGEVPEKTGSS
ncbi:MAG: hypothetical protein FJ217_04275 [Ignavibacteria bacterium]|nr:hypothetical protein [Ignavibacteria bacterium]